MSQNQRKTADAIESECLGVGSARPPRRLNLAELTARLAADNARVAGYIDSLASRVDRLVDATQERNWSEVRRLGEYLAQGGTSYGYPLVAECARRVCDEALRADNETALKRSVIRLVGACGRIERRETLAGGR